MSATLKLTPHEFVEVVSSTAERLVVEVTYGAGGSRPPKHFHPQQDERFEVLAGALSVERDGELRQLGPGEEIEIPRGATHRMWNPGSEPTRARWETAPAGRTEQWFRAIDALHREGRVGRNGMPGVLAFAVFLSEYRDVFRLAGPDPLLRPAFAALAVLGRARGYSPDPARAAA
jgi:mannose-6-phosphate isomerase-like protein (cupin superfamily)